jgi:hypothetical protein
MNQMTYTTMNKQPVRKYVRSLVACFLLVASLTWGAAQSAPQGQAPAAAGTGAQGISSQQALYLVRYILLAVNDANRSGNYTVLRDLAAPDFQAKNSPADLAQIFSDLRRRNFDLFAVAILEPQFTTPPAVDAAGKAHLAGFFPTRPQRISFDLTFEAVAGQWRLFAVAIATPNAPVEQSHLERSSPRSKALVYGVHGLSATAGLRW